MLIYLKNYARDIFGHYSIFNIPPFCVFLTSESFYVKDSIHPFVVVKLFVLHFQLGRSVCTVNVVNIAFVLTSQPPQP